METLRSLYDHSDYGEAYDAMARHVSEMSGLERIIFEDCELVGGKVVAPHVNLTAYPHWLCPEYIAKRIGCDTRQATNLLDCWVILDATREMIETFITWVKSRGVEKALPYFEKLALALAEVENIDPDDVTESEDPIYEAPDLYRYHLVGVYEDEDNTHWIDQQPAWYRKLIAQVKRLRSLDELARIGKETYQIDLSRDRAGVFWTEYNLAKQKLEAQVDLGPTAQTFIQKITSANGNLAAVGAFLYKVQQGRVKVSDPPQKHEWTAIWKTYRETREVHAHV